RSLIRRAVWWCVRVSGSCGRRCGCRWWATVSATCSTRSCGRLCDHGDARTHRVPGPARFEASTGDVMMENAAHTAVPLLQVKHLRTHFFTDAGVVKSVEDVSFALN